MPIARSPKYPSLKVFDRSKPDRPVLANFHGGRAEVTDEQAAQLARVAARQPRLGITVDIDAGKGKGRK